MPVTTTFLFGSLEQEVATLIKDKACRAKAIDIVTGFATPDGIKKIIKPIEDRPEILRSIVIGKATSKGCETLEYLFKLGVQNNRLKVHLGYAHVKRPKKERFRPMIHSKIIYMELSDDMACAFIGSHNLTKFAMSGDNGEAGVLIEGNIDDDNFKNVQNHIKEINNESLIYKHDKREHYEEWAKQSINGFYAEMFTEDDPRTILIFATAEKCKLKSKDSISIILDKSKFKKPLGTEVHLYIFDKLPESPKETFELRHKAKHKFIGKIEDSNSNARKGELAVDYSIRDVCSMPQIIKKDNFTFEKEPQKEVVRCIINIKGILSDNYEYNISSPPRTELAVVPRQKLSDWEIVSDINVELSLFPEETTYEHKMISYYKKKIDD